MLKIIYDAIGTQKQIMPTKRKAPTYILCQRAGNRNMRITTPGSWVFLPNISKKVSTSGSSLISYTCRVLLSIIASHSQLQHRNHDDLQDSKNGREHEEKRRQTTVRQSSTKEADKRAQLLRKAIEHNQRPAILSVSPAIEEGTPYLPSISQLVEQKQSPVPTLQ